VVAAVSLGSAEVQIAKVLRRTGPSTAVDICRAIDEMLADTTYWLRGMLRDGSITSTIINGETVYDLTDAGRRRLL
jgi:hypothetical protein